jgi:hypothetical protein
MSELVAEKSCVSQDEEILGLFRSLLSVDVALPVAAMNALVAIIKVFVHRIDLSCMQV